MITDEGRPARRRTTVRRAAGILLPACLPLAVTLGALAPASSSARSAPAADPPARDGRAFVRSDRDVCAAIAGPAREHCERMMRTATAPRAASQEQGPALWIWAPAATAVLVLVGVRRGGRPESS
ncbi:hypothetical protein [Streptomyces sp. SYP-A7185]|uniref:hypothetical protein n=1 Tax=Streptomyces sp. SYP-A7185 TaxID=3040076 RepID=UPI0038F65D48